jgi:hypothetical protein
MPYELVLTSAAIITALGVIIAAVVATYRVARRIGDAIGVDSKGRTVSERLDRVEHQLWPNGGSSLADHVQQVHEQGRVSAAKLELIQGLLTAQPVEVVVAPTRRRRKTP